MYLRDLAESLRRHWYLILVALAAVALMCTFAAQKISPIYEMKASVVLIPPKSTDDPGANRYLALSGLNQAVDVLTRSLNADRTHEAVKKEVATGKFEVVTDIGTSAPILVVMTTAPNKKAAEQVLDAVLAQVPVNLTRLQTALDIDIGSQITTVPLARDDVPKVNNKKRMRAVAALAVFLLAGSAGLIGAVDGLLIGRRNRRLLATQADDPDAEFNLDVAIMTGHGEARWSGPHSDRPLRKGSATGSRG